MKNIKQVIKDALAEIQKLQIENFTNKNEQDLHWAGLNGKIELLSSMANDLLNINQDKDLLSEIESTKKVINNKIL